MEKNYLLNLKSHQPDIDKIYLYAKDSKHENTGLKHLNDSKTCIKFSNDIEEYKNIIKIFFIKILKNTVQTKNAKY